MTLHFNNGSIQNELTLSTLEEGTIRRNAIVIVSRWGSVPCPGDMVAWQALSLLELPS